MPEVLNHALNIHVLLCVIDNNSFATCNADDLSLFLVIRATN